MGCGRQPRTSQRVPQSLPAEAMGCDHRNESSTTFRTPRPWCTGGSSWHVPLRQLTWQGRRDHGNVPRPGSLARHPYCACVSRHQALKRPGWEEARGMGGSERDGRKREGWEEASGMGGSEWDGRPAVGGFGGVGDPRRARERERGVETETRAERESASAEWKRRPAPSVESVERGGGRGENARALSRCAAASPGSELACPHCWHLRDLQRGLVRSYCRSPMG